MNSFYRHWALEVFWPLLASLVASLIIGAIFRHLHRSGKPTSLKRIFALSGAQPLIWMIWIIGIDYAGEIFASHAQLAVLGTLLPPFRKLALLALMVWFCMRLLRHTHQELKTRKSHDVTNLIALFQMIRLIVVLAAILIALQTLGVPLSGVLAFGGMGGLAVGFAAKDLLANFFGSLMIFLDRPFKVGDSIDLPDHQLKGTIEHIGWRLTTLRNLDKEPVYVPNSLFSTAPIYNSSRMSNRRINTKICLRLIDRVKLEGLLKAIEQMLQEHPDIDVKQLLIVKFCSVGSSSLEFLIDTYTKTTDKKEFHAVQQDVLLKILYLIEAHGAQIAPAAFQVVCV